MDELEKVGALERKRQGLGRPNKLYLKKMFSYLHRERIRQLYTELYKEKNITKFRNTKISIERKVAA